MSEKIQFDPATMRDVSIPMPQIMRLAAFLSLGLLILSLLPYALIWGLPNYDFPLEETLLALAALLGLIVAHEVIHALGWMFFGGVPRDKISFGIDWKTFSPYAHANTPMPVQGYRIGAVLPGIITGMLPVIVGTLIGHGWLTVLGAFLVTGAAGDLIVLWVIRGVPNNARVLDHPTNAGCYVLND
ncbi:MAG: DUF3267 domain-containing protein [Chloroflexi bacterium]|nr:DUF3267 domain-containing protein [Chloroflexota bacterium]